MNEREFLKIEVRPGVKDRFDSMIESLGMKQVQAGTKLFEWFMAQDDVLQHAILGLVPPSVRADVLKMALERLAGNGERPAVKFEGPTMPISQPQPAIREGDIPTPKKRRRP